MSTEQHQTFLEQVMQRIADACEDGSIVYIFVDWRHVDQVLQAGSLVFNELKNICIWVKSNAGQGSFYRSRHEMVCVFKAGLVHTSTPSSLDSMAVPAQIFGNMPELTPSRRGVRTN